MSIFKEKNKGFDCEENEDGTARCMRTFKGKDGNMLTDGQEFTIWADPSNNCEPRLMGHVSVLDDEWGDVDKMAKRIAAGCKRTQNSKSQGGYTQ